MYIAVEKVTQKCSKPIKTSVPYSTLASSKMNKTVIYHPQTVMSLWQNSGCRFYADTYTIWSKYCAAILIIRHSCLLLAKLQFQAITQEDTHKYSATTVNSLELEGFGVKFSCLLAEHWKVLHFLLRHYNELVHKETFWKNKVSVIREQDRGNLAILNGHRKNNVVMMCRVYWSEGCDWKAERRAWETRAGHYNWIPMGEGKNMMDKASTLWLHPSLHLLSICS